MRIAKRHFSSLDRQTVEDCEFLEPDRYGFLEDIAENARFIPRGAGLSYVAASFGSKTPSLGFSRFNRILSFNSGAPSVTVEAGISLHKLHVFLAPQGLRVPVEPGHPQITIGGCIAFNVFGKNQFREGLFESCVEELELFHPKKGIVRASRTENKELFDLTIGGMGLTGLILKATIRLNRIPSAWLTVENIPVKNLHDMVGVMKERSKHADSLHSFNDFTRFGNSLGAGFVMLSNYRKDDAEPEILHSFKSLERKPSRSPAFFNSLTAPLFALAYRALNTKIRPTARVPFYAFNYPVASTPFYFDWYGKKGFVERQILVPEKSVEKYIEKFEALLRKHRPQIVLGSCKFFSGTQSLLHFAGTGLVISIDVLPSEKYRAFHDALDALNVEMKAIDNIAKDSRVSKELVEAEYPEYKKFQECLTGHDPNRQLSSALSDTLCL